MGRLRPHLNTIPLLVRSCGAENPQISVLFEVPKIEQLTETVKAGFANLEQRFGNLEKGFASLEGRNDRNSKAKAIWRAKMAAVMAPARVSAL
jgi:hypothetical protein